MLKKMMLLGSVCVLGLAVAAHADQVQTFVLTVDDCTGGCGVGSPPFNFGTVVLDQTATGVNVTVTLAANEHFSISGAGNALDFNLTNPSLVVDNLTTGFTASAPSGGDHADGTGDFTNVIACNTGGVNPPCTSGGNTGNSSGPVSFTVEGATLASFIKNSSGNYFSVDILGGNGNTGDVAATTGGTVTTTSSVPEPSSLLLMGTGLAGVAAAIRRRMSRV